MTTRFLRVSAGVAVLLVLVLLASATAASGRGIGAPVRLEVKPLAPTITTKTVTVGTKPNFALYDPATKEVYVANEGSKTVSAISSTTYAVTSIPVGTEPLLITYAPSTQDLYVLNFETSISVISSANKVVKTITFPKGDIPVTQVYDPANGDVYVICDTSTVPQINDINQKTFALTPVSLPIGSLYAIYDNASSSLVVSGGMSNELTAISSKDVPTTIKLTAGISPEWMVYNPNDKDLYIVDDGATTKGISKTGNISVLTSANKITATVKIGAYPTLAFYDPANHDIYAMDTGIPSKPYPVSSVSIISGTTVSKTLTVGKYAVVAGYDPKNSEMYVSCPGSNLTYAITSGNAITAMVATPQYSTAAEYDPSLGDMLAVGFPTFGGTAAANTIVTVIPSTNTGTSTVTLGKGPPGGVGYDPTDSGFFVVNSGTTTVSFIL